MPTIIQYRELVRKAFAFLLEEKAMHPEQSFSTLLDAAGCRFNLGPADCAALERLLAEHRAAPTREPSNGERSA